MRGEYQSVRWIEAKNVGSTTLNPFALAEVSGAELSRAGHTILHIKEPTEDNVFPLAITNWMPIPASGYGVAAMEGPVYVQYYVSDTPAVGEVWGPANGSQKANSGLTGLTIVGAVDEDREIVLVNFWTGEEAVEPTPWYVGKTTAAIASGKTGSVLQYCESWSYDEETEELVFAWVASDPPQTFTVLNPHDIELPGDLKVRWTKYPCWTNWIVEPWQWTECPPDGY